MAVGDIISETYPAVTLSYFVPAAGVEIIVTSGIGRTTSVYFGITDGVQIAYTNSDDDATSGARYSLNIKLGITNTNYLLLYANSTGVGFTGIQTK